MSFFMMGFMTKLAKLEMPDSPDEYYNKYKKKEEKVRVDRLSSQRENFKTDDKSFEQDMKLKEVSKPKAPPPRSNGLKKIKPPIRVAKVKG